MAELSLDTIQQSIAACNKNILKIRKYIRDNQASLTAHSTNQLNKICKDILPAGMQLKRNYGHLALRSVGGKANKETVKEKPVKAEPEGEYEYEYEEVEVDEPSRRSHGRSECPTRRPAGRSEYENDQMHAYNGQPQYENDYREDYHNYNALSNADLARQCFMPAAMARYRNRQWCWLRALVSCAKWVIFNLLNEVRFNASRLSSYQ